jgi:hypothetical protein
MKTLEYNHGGNWIDRLLNRWPFCLDANSMRTVAIARDAQGWYKPGARSLFYNGYVFVRLTWPLGLWLHVRLTPDHRSQFGAGWKLNGRFGLTFRPWQANASGARGAHPGAPNVGHASAWERGTA